MMRDGKRKPTLSVTSKGAYSRPGEWDEVRWGVGERRGIRLLNTAGGNWLIEFRIRPCYTAHKLVSRRRE